MADRRARPGADRPRRADGDSRPRAPPRACWPPAPPCGRAAASPSAWGRGACPPPSSCCSPLCVPSAGPCSPPRLSGLHVERLRSLLTRPRLELDLVALAKLLELDARAETRAVEEHVVRPVIRRNEAEAFVPHDALDRPGHGTPRRPASSQRLAPLASAAPRGCASHPLC